MAGYLGLGLIANRYRPFLMELEMRCTINARVRPLAGATTAFRMERSVGPFAWLVRGQWPFVSRVSYCGIERSSRGIVGLSTCAIDAPNRDGLARPAAESFRAQSAPIAIGGCTRSCALRRASRSVHLILQRSVPGSRVGNASACLLQLDWGAQTVPVRTGLARATMRTSSSPICWGPSSPS